MTPGLRSRAAGTPSRTDPCPSSRAPAPPVPPSRCRRSGSRGRCSSRRARRAEPAPFRFPQRRPALERKRKRKAGEGGEGAQAVGRLWPEPDTRSGGSAACALPSAPGPAGNQGSEASERLRTDLPPRPFPVTVTTRYGSAAWPAGSSAHPNTSKRLKPKNPQGFIPSESVPRRQSRSSFSSSPASTLFVHTSNWRHLIQRVSSHQPLLLLSVGHSPACSHLSSCPLLSQRMGIHSLEVQPGAQSAFHSVDYRPRHLCEKYSTQLSLKYIIGITLQ